MKFRCLPLWAMGLAIAGLAGCSSSPPVHYYTLLAPADDTSHTQSAAAASYMLEVLPVTVPAQADQPQLMVRDGAGGVTPFYSDRWSAPLGDEVRAGLSYTLASTLNTLDVQSIKAPANAALWRVQVDVQRFDNTLDGLAVLDAIWRIRPVNLGGSALLCRTVVQVPIQGLQIPTVVGAQQRALADLGRTIASGIRSGGQNAQAASPAAEVSGCTQKE
jgi:uncharacterized lipoprotein YmbA